MNMVNVKVNGIAVSVPERAKIQVLKYLKESIRNGKLSIPHCMSFRRSFAGRSVYVSL